MSRLLRRWLKFFVPRTLFGQSLLIIIVPMLLFQAVMTYVFFERHFDTVTRRLSLGVASDINFLIDAYALFPKPDQVEALNKLAEEDLRLQVTFEPGAELPKHQQWLFFAFFRRELKHEIKRVMDYPYWVDTHAEEGKIDIRIQLPNGVLNVLAPRDRISSKTVHIFLGWMIGSAIVLMLVAVFFLREQVRPILKLAEAADQFGKGRDVPGFRPRGAREVRLAATAFIRMRARTKRHIEQRTVMLAAVSHDVRTPLTRMKLQLALLPESEEISDLRADVAEMERIVDEYLAFVGGRSTEGPAPTDIADLLQEIVADARKRGAEVTLETAGDLGVETRRNAMKRCIGNLVENAGRYGTHTALSAQRRDDYIEIHVDDNGPGIPEAHREEAFRPFHRLDESRSPDQGGVGLGLAIARDLARGQGGDVKLGMSPLGGLRATVRLPV
jgi:two-component system osmolarity sensor histidine kinase EnvZ